MDEISVRTVLAYMEDTGKLDDFVALLAIAIVVGAAVGGGLMLRLARKQKRARALIRRLSTAHPIESGGPPLDLVEQHFLDQLKQDLWPHGEYLRNPRRLGR
ncbi:hypothetical protein GT755_12265 [Herbidospora sp. NEAU-GS84]|uniref:Uncharacterized protein n=1 Tax=Herbidospora solisilvae TaxID=2696284 RepID=A0A7C9NMU8_9ACTN|nr:hypothetical protein [Herbidospora solisilvae]NAS22456.1 hypothetical protein [Herbidospora solisilvae]